LDVSCVNLRFLFDFVSKNDHEHQIDAFRLKKERIRKKERKNFVKFVNL